VLLRARGRGTLRPQPLRQLAQRMQLLRAVQLPPTPPPRAACLPLRARAGGTRRLKAATTMKMTTRSLQPKMTTACATRPLRLLRRCWREADAAQR
jgi:hypothetical protein